MNKRLKKLLGFILSMALLITTAMGTAAMIITTVTYDISELEGKYKTQGRTPLVDGAVMLDWSAAGIEWKADCSGDVSITVTATRIADTSDLGGLYFSVYVDGVMQAEDLRIPTDNSQDTWRSNSTNYPFHITELGDSQFTIAEDLEAGEHTFAIYNQTQAGMGAFGVKEITLNGTFLEPPAENELYIEVVGDSISASHGILATNATNNANSADAPLYEDATRAWPFLAAQTLNADWSVIAKSGITAIEGIGWSGSASVSMQDVYPYERYYSDKITTHDFENSRQPDVIVLCLGTNDCWTWNGTGGTTPLTDDQKIDGFKTMLQHLRDRNANAKIIWVYGMMTNDADSYIQQAVSEMGGTENGYYTLALPMSRSGGQGHPSLSAQTTYAALVSEKINEIADDVIEEPNTLDIWDGTEIAPTYGTGVENDPYLISTPEEFSYIIGHYYPTSKYYKLTTDIYLNDITKINWQDGTIEDGYTVNDWYSNCVFRGVLDGDGHTVYGLYSTDETADIRLGLIPITEEGGSSPTTIKNLGVDYAYVNAPNGSAGAFVGTTKHGNTTSFDTCYVGANVTVHGVEAGLFCGRGGSDVAISKSYSLGTVTGTSGYGVVGNCWGSIRTIDNSFFVNALITSRNSMTCTNVYATNTQGGTNAVQLTSDKMKGLDVLANESKMPSLAECGAFTATRYYPIATVFMKEPVIAVWDGTEIAPVNGAGTENDPYLIFAPEELAYVIKQGGEGKYYKLTADIYLNDTTKIDWQDGTVADGYTVNQWYKESNTNPFYGVLDGDGHTVYGLYISDDATNVRMGLIPWIQEGGASPTTIKNLGVDCAYVNAPNGCAGAIVGRTRQNNTLTFDTCNVGEDVTVNGIDAGLFCGRGGSNIAISKSYSLGTVTGTSSYGVVGNCWGGTRTIDNSFFVNASITSTIVNSITCTNVYVTDSVGGKNAVQLTSDKMQGLDALTNESKMSGLAECEAFTATESYPVLRKFLISVPEYTVYTLTLNPNGGTVSTESIKAVAGAVIEFPTPVKGGFIFKAWYTDEELTTQATNIMPAEDVTYYAKWYKLYDVDNDGEVDSSDLIQLRIMLLESNDISVDGADCNQDGQINIIDLIRLKKALSGEFVRAEYLGNITSGQDGAVFGDYLFRFDAQGQCYVYLLDEISNNSVPITVFTLDKVNTIRPHSNSVMFSNTYYNADDEFPLLYANVYNNYANADQQQKGVTCVYRLEKSNNTFTTTLVQVIEIGFTEDSIWKSKNGEDVRPFGNFAIDTQNARYYAFTMRDEDEITRYFAFNLPDVNSGDYDDTLGAKHVILETTDIIDYFDCDYHRYLQGACCENGIIYSLEGFTDDKNNPPAIRLIDINAKTQRKIYYFADAGLTIEPEFIDFEDGICYYADHDGNLYKLIF